MTQLKPQRSTSLDSDKPDELNSRISPWLAKLLYFIGSKIILPLFFSKIKIDGQENIPLQGPVIVAPTHRSRWDAFIVPYAVGRLVSGRDLRFMVSANEVRGFQGWVIRRMGGFPVDTERPQLSSLRYSVELLKQQPMLVIFPEGGIFNDYKIHPLKRGVAVIALQAQADKSSQGVKILPVGVRYSQPDPSWGTEVMVNIGSPLSVDEYCDKSLRKNSQNLTTDLEKSLQQIYEK